MSIKLIFDFEPKIPKNSKKQQKTAKFYENRAVFVLNRVFFSEN